MDISTINSLQLNTIVKGVKWIINQGTAHASSEEQPVIRLLNSTALLAIVVILTTQVITIPLMGIQRYSLLSSLLFLAQNVGIIRMNQLSKVKYAKGLFLFGCYACVVTLHIAYDVEVASWVFLICLYSYFGAIFKKKRNLIFHSILTTTLAVCSIILHHARYFEPLIENNDYEVMCLHIMIFVCTALFVLANMHSLRVNLKNHQKQLEAMIIEKNLLLKEVHHRVNNNLQLISSFLSIQGRQLNEQMVSRSAYDGIQLRIQSMAVIHQELSNMSYSSSVPFRRYVINLTSHLAALFEISRRNIELNVQVEEVYIKPEKVVHLGLIITEILTNTFKHAFQNEKKGKVELSYTDNGKTQQLFIRDNGQGLSGNAQHKKRASGMGLQMISELTDQLNGCHTMKVDGGLCHTITLGEEIALHNQLLEKEARVLILEDDQIVAHDIYLLLKECSIEALKVHNYDQAVAALDHWIPDLIFCDINLNDKKNGLDFIQMALEKAPWIKVVIITAYMDMQTLKSALTIKPAHYLVKPFTRSQLTTTTQMVMEEIKKTASFRKAITTLTSQELKILKLIARERSSAEIAENLILSEKTVRNHRYNIAKKLEIPNKKNSLVMWAVQHKHLL